MQEFVVSLEAVEAMPGILVHGGFSLEGYFTRSQTENRDILKEILKYCVDNGITEFCDLVEAVFQMDNNDWIDIITCRNTMFLSAYLKSRYYRSQQPERPALGQGILIDRLSGEEI